MVSHENLGIKLNKEFYNKLNSMFNKLEVKYGKIDIVHTRNSPNIKLTNNQIDYFVEINCWDIIIDNKAVENIFSMLDKQGTYYYISNDEITYLTNTNKETKTLS